MGMKKISWEYAFLFLQMSFAGIFVLVIYSYYISTGQQSFLNRGMYSENVRGIQLSNNYLVSAMNEQVDFHIDSISTDGEYAIYRNVAEDYQEIVRGIYETKDLFGYSKYIKSGRFFQTEDFTSHKKAAVIGSEMLDLTYTENGVRYYGYDDTLYEVIGVFKQTDSDLDYVVYLNLVVLLEADNDNGLYYIDSKNPSTVDGIINNIIENAANQYTTSTVEYESQVTNMGLGFENNTLLFCAILSACFNLIITLHYFAAKNKYTTAIQKLCGMTWKDLTRDYSIKTGGMVISSIVFIIVIVKMFSGKLFFLNEDNLGWQHFATAGITLAVLGTVTTAGIVHSVQHVNISDTLKGR